MFDKACGIRCIVINPAEKDGFEQRLYHPFCASCADAQRSRFESLRCEDVHRYAALQAERWNGKYEYLCPAGAAFIASTLQQSSDNALGVVAGPFLMVEQEDFTDDDLERFYHGDVPQKVLSVIPELPYIEPSRVNYLADILFILSSYAGQRELLDYKIMAQMAANRSELFYSVHDIKQKKSPDYQYPIESEQLLQRYIEQGDKEAAQRVLNEILGHILLCSGGSMDMIKSRVTELIVLLSRAAIAGGAGTTEIFGLNDDYLSEIRQFKTMDQLNTWLAKVLVRFTNRVFTLPGSRHEDIIKKAMEYIRKNYMLKISLNDISEHVNLSVSYLSKIFKEETGKSISEFINTVKVENSKLLLLNNDIPLIEVSYLAGFDDQSYFTKVFKRNTGTTPGRFREKRGNV
jgi:AraC-like DNA-binding protein/ligand-binding sensor protein